MRRQRVDVLAGAVSKRPHPRPAVRQRGPRGLGRRGRPGQVRQQRFGLAVGRLGLVGLAGRGQEPRHGREAAADVDFGLDVRPRLGRQRLAGGEDLPVSRQCVFLAADLVRQFGQLEVGLRQRPTRHQVRLLAQQRPELAVEVAGRGQEPVAQVLEFLLLEQEVLAHAGVERLDRVRRQLVPRLHRRARLAELSVGFVQRRVRVRLSLQRLSQPGVGHRLDRRHGGQPAQ